MFNTVQLFQCAVQINMATEGWLDVHVVLSQAGEALTEKDCRLATGGVGSGRGRMNIATVGWLLVVLAQAGDEFLNTQSLPIATGHKEFAKYSICKLYNINQKCTKIAIKCNENTTLSRQTTSCIKHNQSCCS